MTSCALRISKDFKDGELFDHSLKEWVEVSHVKRKKNTLEKKYEMYGVVRGKKSRR